MAEGEVQMVLYRMHVLAVKPRPSGVDEHTMLTAPVLSPAACMQSCRAPKCLATATASTAPQTANGSLAWLQAASAAAWVPSLCRTAAT